MLDRTNDFDRQYANWKREQAKVNAETARLERMAEAEFKANRPLPKGRNFVYWEHTETPEYKDAYRVGYDAIQWHNAQPECFHW